MKAQRLNDKERRDWILNDEGLYDWQRSSGDDMYDFIRKNRKQIDEVIGSVRDGKKSQHYLKYG